MALPCVSGTRECNGCGACRKDMPKKAYICDHCGAIIYEQEEYYSIDGYHYCEICMTEKFKRTAEAS